MTIIISISRCIEKARNAQLEESSEKHIDVCSMNSWNMANGLSLHKAICVCVGGWSMPFSSILRRNRNTEWASKLTRERGRQTDRKKCEFEKRRRFKDKSIDEKRLIFWWIKFSSKERERDRERESMNKHRHWPLIIINLFFSFSLARAHTRRLNDLSSCW